MTIIITGEEEPKEERNLMKKPDKHQYTNDSNHKRGRGT